MKLNCTVVRQNQTKEEQRERKKLSTFSPFKQTAGYTKEKQKKSWISENKPKTIEKEFKF